jgi:hypothetical protein
MIRYCDLNRNQMFTSEPIAKLLGFGSCVALPPTGRRVLADTSLKMAHWAEPCVEMDMVISV